MEMIKDDIVPGAVMTEVDKARWRALPADQRLQLVQAAVQMGMNSPASPLSMDDLWQQALARNPNAKL